MAIPLEKSDDREQEVIESYPVKRLGTHPNVEIHVVEARSMRDGQGIQIGNIYGQIPAWEQSPNGRYYKLVVDTTTPEGQQLAGSMDAGAFINAVLALRDKLVSLGSLVAGDLTDQEIQNGVVALQGDGLFLDTYNAREAERVVLEVRQNLHPNAVRRIDIR